MASKLSRKGLISNLFLCILELTLYFQTMDFKNQFEFALFRMLIVVHGVLPYSLALAKLRLLGRVLGQVPWFRRNVVESNLRAVYPHLTDSEVVAMRRNVYDHLSRTIAETFFAPEEKLLSGVTINPGWGVLDDALARGKGVILATAHVGNFELGGRILARRYNLLDVIKPQRNKPFDHYLKAKRLERGINTVPMARAVRPVLQHLKNQGVVSLLLDQDAGKQGVSVPFLGLPASTWPGAARIAIRTGAPVVPVALLRTGSQEFVLEVGEPLDPAQWNDTAADVAAFTARISGAVEEYIKAYPEQWFWVHRRWKGASEAREQ